MRSSTALSVILLCALITFCSGCLPSCRSATDGDGDKVEAATPRYVYSDLRTMTDAIADNVLAHPFMQRESGAPTVVVLGIYNPTALHINTKEMTDTLRRKLRQSDRVRLVNAAARDNVLRQQECHPRNATPDMQMAIAKRLGAKYMLTGSVVKLTKRPNRDIRDSKRKRIYYQLIIEVTDIETGLIAAALKFPLPH